MEKLGTYKRPTKVIDLPSGKKVEIVAYFSRDEIDEIRSIMVKGQKIKGAEILKMEAQKASGNNVDVADLFGGMEFDFTILNEASKLTRRLAVKTLIDENGNKYEADDESIRTFFNEEDSLQLDKELNELNKKKQTENSLQKH
ncbi:MAG TPA: hypothetical protein DDY21_00215 [Candidatus Moranbacteria bacterium]|nr:hypothetical protein [Candidatus Moranbacteria bacterium]